MKVKTTKLVIPLIIMYTGAVLTFYNSAIPWKSQCTDVVQIYQLSIYSWRKCFQIPILLARKASWKSRNKILTASKMCHQLLQFLKTKSFTVLKTLTVSFKMSTLSRRRSCVKQRLSQSRKRKSDLSSRKASRRQRRKVLIIVGKHLASIHCLV